MLQASELGPFPLQGGTPGKRADSTILAHTATGVTGSKDTVLPTEESHRNPTRGNSYTHKSAPFIKPHQNHNKPN